MKTIYKYNLQVTDVQQIILPKGAKILCVQTQRNNLAMWAEVDTDEITETESVIIGMFGTGHPIPQQMEYNRHYISTFQIENGALVFHVYKRMDV